MVSEPQTKLGPKLSPLKAAEEGAEVCGYFRLLLTSALLQAWFKHSANKPQAEGLNKCCMRIVFA